MSATRPTSTPALLTGPRTLRPPMLSKRASTRYVSVARSAPRLPTFIASTRSATKPAVTKAPNHRSIVVLSIGLSGRLGKEASALAAQHERGEHEVECEDGERGAHDGAGGGPGHAFRRGRCVVAFERRDHGDRESEHDALHDAVQNIIPEVHRRLHLRPEGAVVHAEEHDRDHVAAEDAHRRE